jgi:hypothetical protein
MKASVIPTTYPLALGLSKGFVSGETLPDARTSPESSITGTKRTLNSS